MFSKAHSSKTIFEVGLVDSLEFDLFKFLDSHVQKSKGRSLLFLSFGGCIINCKGDKNTTPRLFDV